MNKAYQGDRRPYGELEVLVQCDGIEFFGAGDTGLHWALDIWLYDPILGCVFVSDPIDRGTEPCLVRSSSTLRLFRVFRSINKPCRFEVEVIGVLHRNIFGKERKRKEKVLIAGKDELKWLTMYEVTVEIIPPTPIAAKFPANISYSPPVVSTLMAPELSLAVVISHAAMPATSPHMAPWIQPHLFAFDQVAQRTMGTTALPRNVPMKSWKWRV